MKTQRILFGPFRDGIVAFWRHKCTQPDEQEITAEDKMRTTLMISHEVFRQMSFCFSWGSFAVNNGSSRWNAAELCCRLCLLPEWMFKLFEPQKLSRFDYVYPNSLLAEEKRADDARTRIKHANEHEKARKIKASGGETGVRVKGARSAPWAGGNILNTIATPGKLEMFHSCSSKSFTECFRTGKLRNRDCPTYPIWLVLCLICVLCAICLLSCFSSYLFDAALISRFIFGSNWLVRRLS